MCRTLQKRCRLYDEHSKIQHLIKWPCTGLLPRSNLVPRKPHGLQCLSPRNSMCFNFTGGNPHFVTAGHRHPTSVVELSSCAKSPPLHSRPTHVVLPLFPHLLIGLPPMIVVRLEAFLLFFTECQIPCSARCILHENPARYILITTPNPLSLSRILRCRPFAHMFACVRAHRHHTHAQLCPSVRSFYLFERVHVCFIII